MSETPCGFVNLPKDLDTENRRIFGIIEPFLIERSIVVRHIADKVRPKDSTFFKLMLVAPKDPVQYIRIVGDMRSSHVYPQILHEIGHWMVDQKALNEGWHKKLIRNLSHSPLWLLQEEFQAWTYAIEIHRLHFSNKIKIDWESEGVIIMECLRSHLPQPALPKGARSSQSE